MTHTPTTRVDAGRGFIGTMTALPSYDDESYLDFVEGLRGFALRKVTPVAATQVRQEAERRGSPQEIKELRALADPIPVVAARNRLLRSTQGMNWERVLQSYDTRRQELETELARHQDMGPARLELDPDFTYPEYYDSVHYHRQPGGYHDDPLAGYIYHYGTKVFHIGGNDHDESKIANAAATSQPADGRVTRVLDVACAIGSTTVAFKDRWPDAQVWGVEASAPLLRYAHARAVRLGAEVNFSQRLAEDLRFPDEYFDLVYMSTLLHEMPVEEGRQALREAHRVLRPGGVLEVRDMQPASSPIDPWADYSRDFDSRFNTEPYAYPFVHSGVSAFLEELFVSVDITPGHMTTWRCTA